MSTQLARTAEPIDYMGMQAVFRVTKEMSGGTYQAFENITPPGTGVPLHTHPTDDETLFVEQGRLTCVLGAAPVRGGDRRLRAAAGRDTARVERPGRRDGGGARRRPSAVGRGLRAHVPRAVAADARGLRGRDRDLRGERDRADVAAGDGVTGCVGRLR